jgi:hypothetical protein
VVGGRQVNGAAAHRQRAPASPVPAGRAVTVMLAEAVYLHDHVLAQVELADATSNQGEVAICA